MQPIQQDLSGSSSQQHFPADKLAYHEFFMPPPQHTAMRPLMHSRKPLPGESDETDRHRGGGASLSQFVHTKNSVYRVIDPYEADDEFAIPPPQQSAVRPQPEQSSNPLLIGTGNQWDETYRRHGASLSHFVHANTSVYSVVNPYEAYDEFVIPPPQQSAVRRRHLEQSSNPFANTTKRTKNRSLNEDQTVKQYLRPLVTLPDTTTIYEARCLMAASDVDFLVLIDSIGLLCGILTQEDIATRVINHGIDLVNTPVSKVMTRNPIFVLSDTLDVEALQKMVQGEVTRLPVIEKGEVIGLVCIMDCLRDADKITGRRAAKLMAANWDALERYC
ncbi:unnamed protein product [Lactuca virosa]|uniref:CBS domain-containing protein n=1 Tax=Lactuca virosa TaxID=75947 RepID=A0AAU9N7V3_9ASTR|nr:unnamed protein product [Lactuca virosa]